MMKNYEDSGKSYQEPTQNLNPVLWYFPVIVNIGSGWIMNAQSLEVVPKAHLGVFWFLWFSKLGFVITISE